MPRRPLFDSFSDTGVFAAAAAVLAAASAAAGDDAIVEAAPADERAGFARKAMLR